MKLTAIHNLFDIKYGNSLELINLEQCQKGDLNSIDFVSRTEKNNGISAFVLKVDDIEPNPANTITVAVGGSVLATFLQPEQYYTGFHVLVLSPKKEMKTDELLFYTMCIRENKYKYNYGRQANKTLKNILVPSEVPSDFKNIDFKKLNTLKRDSMLNKDDFYLDKNNWENFDLNSLFKITGSQTTPILELEEYGNGIYPYVTTQTTNNGVEGFYDFYTEERNILTVDSAVLGFCSYQPENFSASDHVEKLIPKFRMNKYISMFLVTILNKEQYRYNYGRKCSQARMKEIKIKLPAKNGQPNCDFMENYIKSLSYSNNI